MSFQVSDVKALELYWLNQLQDNNIFSYEAHKWIQINWFERLFYEVFDYD